MTKTQKVVARIRDGHSDEEILKEFDCLASFLKRCHTFAKKEVDKEAKIHEKKKVHTPPVPDKNEPPIQAQLPADMMNLFTQFCAQLSNGQAPVHREERTTCHRHPRENVKAGENCELCLKASKLDHAREQLNKTAIPCPKCQESKYFKFGGVIRKTKNGNYVCGQCQITYNARGESSEWGKETRSV